MGGRKWGQHFFWNRGLAEKIVDLIPITPEDYVLEIGPGKGILTRFILNRTPHLTALEIDPELAEGLREMFPGLSLLQGDFLEQDLSNLLPPRFKVVSNLPYKISRPTLQRILQWRESLQEAVLVVQKELAERVVPHSTCYEASPLSISLHIFYRMRIAFHLSPGSFNPPPKVDSSALIFQKRDLPLYSPEDFPHFYSFLQRLFNPRRKSIRNRLEEKERTPALEAGFDLTKRAEELSEERLISLYRAIYDPSRS